MPGGTLKTENGEILIRTMGQAYSGSDFSNIVVLTRPDGTRVTLGEIADIKDTFEEGDLLAAFNGAPAVMVNVSQVGSEWTSLKSPQTQRDRRRVQPHPTPRVSTPTSGSIRHLS